MTVRFKKISDGAKAPVYSSASAAGADLFACIDLPLIFAPGETVAVPTGIACELPEGTVGLVCARSGMATKRGLAPANKVGVIDSDYRGEIKVVLLNHSSAPQTVAPGERIAQLLIVPYIAADFTESDSLSDTVRGEGGFGSTGA